MAENDFVIENGILKKYTGAGGDIVIPDGVTEIGKNAFNSCRDLSTVIIPDTVRKIGPFAFAYCRNLTSVSLPKSIEFLGCNLLEYNKCGAFENCTSLESVEIFSNLKGIGENLFKGCKKLTYVKIAEHVWDYLPANTFIGCPSPFVFKTVEDTATKQLMSIKRLEGVIPDEENEKLICEYIVKNKKKLLPLIVNNGNTNAFVALVGMIGKSKIALDDVDLAIKQAEGNAEMTASLLDYKNRIYSKSEIDRKQAYKTDIALGIKERTLSDWKALFTLSENESGYVIKKYKGTDQVLEIPESIGGKTVYAINTEAFSGSDVTNVFIPDSVLSVGASAFAKCDKLQYTVFDNGLYLGNPGNPYRVYVGPVSANAGVVNLHADTMVISDGVFQNCDSIIGITIPAGVKTIGKKTFYYCKNLSSVKMQDGLISIGDEAFRYCKNLADAALPKSLTTIGDFAFEGCNSLPYISVPEGVTAIGESVFSGCKKAAKLVLQNGLVSVGKNAFNGCASITELVLPDTVTEISNFAFCDCIRLASVRLSSNMKKTGKFAFRGCKRIESIIIPDGINVIEDSSFQYCSKLKSINIPDSVITVEARAFEECTALERIVVPENTKEIQYYAFLECSKLTDATICGKNTEIGSDTFARCNTIVIHAPSGSYAEQYAKENEIPFEVI